MADNLTAKEVQATRLLLLASSFRDASKVNDSSLMLANVQQLLWSLIATSIYDFVNSGAYYLQSEMGGSYQ